MDCNKNQAAAFGVVCVHKTFILLAQSVRELIAS